MKVALATGITANVLAWGEDAPGETTVVLVHGFSDLAFGWAPVAALLARHAHVIAPDLRGHGDTDWIGPGGYYHFLDYVADLDSVIAQCARTRVILVGHSMGGSVSGYYAGARPERVQGLVLIEGLGPPDQSTADGPTRTAMWIDAWRTARTPRTPMASLDVAVARLRKHDPRLDEPTARALAERGTKPATEPGDPPGAVRWKLDPLHHTFGPYPYRLETAQKHWARVTCPTVIVDGANSELNLAPDERARRRQSFVAHRHVVIPDAGHAVPRHQPAAVAELILDLVRG